MERNGEGDLVIEVRPMGVGDTDAVRQVEAAAFGAWLEEAKGRESDLPPRTRANVLLLREKDPAGCFVAVDEGRVVGFIFSRTWGSVGWFGTFGVLPEHQGVGIGKRLMDASLAYLRREPDRLIGLETMPDSADNLGLYLSHGFQARMLTLKLRKKLARSTAAELGLPSWSRAGTRERQRWLSDLREATGHIRPGLDYTKEIVSTARHEVGDTVVLQGPDGAIGFSIVRLRDRREGQDKERASVEVLALEPDRADEEALQALLEASEALACSRGKREVVLPVNARHTWALDQLLASGYRVKDAAVRMVLAGTDGGPRTDRRVDLSRWAG